MGGLATEFALRQLERLAGGSFCEAFRGPRPNYSYSPPLSAALEYLGTPVGLEGRITLSCGDDSYYGFDNRLFATSLATVLWDNIDGGSTPNFNGRHLPGCCSLADPGSTI